jgi:2-hydroxychromene-2-carboxylate isomerase/predicted enzyme related to lactoylglutathione lyase
VKAVLRFYFDYISSNAYLAWSQLHAIAERHRRRVEPVPVLFAALLEAHGQLGPAEVPPKGLWMARNNLRKAVLLGLPLRPPASHPFNPLLALRVSSLPIAEDARRRLIDALFASTWALELRVDDPAVVARAADGAGLDGEALVAEAGRAESKARLRRQTELAIAADVFGVPTVIVDGELFWGYDDFPFLTRFLDGTDPIEGEAVKAWRRPTPSAMRRQHRERRALRLSHVNLPARDPDAQVRWYAERLGLEARARFVLGPGTLIAFEPGEPIGPAGNSHIGFEVASAEEVAAWAARFGTPVESEAGSASTKLRDPEGNQIEIYWEPGGPAA